MSRFMRSHRCRRADSASCRFNSLQALRLGRVFAANRGLLLACGLMGTIINATGSEADIARSEGELVFNHRLAAETPSTVSRETTAFASSDSRPTEPPTTASSIEGKLPPRRMLLPAALQRFAATIILESSVFDALPGERDLRLSGTTGFDARRSGLMRQESLFVLNYPSEKRARARFAVFAPSAVWDRASTHFFVGMPFEQQTQTGFLAALVPDLFHLVSTSPFVANTPSRVTASLPASQESAVSAPFSPDTYAPTWARSPVSRFDQRDWDRPGRAAAESSSAAFLIANAADSNPSEEALVRPVSPSLALASGSLVSHLSFGTNGARLSGNGTIAGDVILDPSLGIAPGNSPGLLTVTGGLTWSQGGFFELEIQDPTGGPGTGWDAIQVNGILQFTATIGEPFVIHLSSLTDSGASGNISNFLATRPYALQVLTATGGINGFNPAAVRFTTSGFTNALDGGSFALLASGDELMLTFTPVPEPSTWALMLTGASVLAAKLIRRRRRA